MSSSAESGGANGADRRTVDTLILTYDRETDRLEVGGHCNSLDLMLDMLGRAQRILESKWRLQQMAIHQQELFEQQKNQQIADAIRSRR